jgi:hypothetical protein
MIVHARELDAVQEPGAEAGVRSETAIIRGTGILEPERDLFGDGRGCKGGRARRALMAWTELGSLERTNESWTGLHARL